MTNSKIFYIHGFGSSVNSETLKKLQKSFPDAVGLTYDHSEPEASLMSLVAQLQQYANDDLIIVASSLGGWYAEKLTGRIIANYILYNPSTQPEKTLSRHNLSQEILYKYKTLNTNVLPVSSRNVIISIDDETIDPVIADNKYRETADMTYTAGGHRMTPEAMNVIVNKINFLENQLHDR